MPYANYYLEPFKAAARSFAVEETIAPVRDGSELESVIAAQVSARDGRFVVMPDSFTDTYRRQIISLAARYELPAVYRFRYWAKDGGGTRPRYSNVAARPCRRADRLSRAHVRYWHKADMALAPFDVCLWGNNGHWAMSALPPKSGHRNSVAKCPLSARSGHSPRVLSPRDQASRREKFHAVL